MATNSTIENKSKFRLFYEEDGVPVEVDLNSEEFSPCQKCMHNIFELALRKQIEKEKIATSEYLMRLEQNNQGADALLFRKRNARPLRELELA